jgi:hypothetical protein
LAGKPRAVICLTVGTSWHGLPTRSQCMPRSMDAIRRCWICKRSKKEPRRCGIECRPCLRGEGATHYDNRTVLAVAAPPYSIAAHAPWRLCCCGIVWCSHLGLPRFHIPRRLVLTGLTISISPRKILAVLGSLLLGWVSYISVRAINNGSAISALQEQRVSDQRQDTELREIRRTIQDMTVLFFEEHHGEESIERPPDFSAAQMAIESLVNQKGGK